MRRNLSGFTIVEIVVTVTVISILVAVAFFGYSRIQMDARNSERSSKVKILTEALEKYYGTHGEYPSCSAMMQNGSTVSTNVLPGLEADVLVTPNSSPATTNSITSCTPLSAGSGSDVFAYVGDGSTTCISGNACLEYTLQYRNESNGTIVSQASTHRTQVASSVGSTLTATPISATQINLSWTAVGNATGYQLQQATDTAFSQNLATSTPSGTAVSATGLSAGTTYYFRIAPTASTGQGAWSNTASATTVINPPASAPTVTAALVSAGANAEGTASVVTCTSGTAEYQLRQYTTTTSTPGAWSSWSAWSTGRILNITALQGRQHAFQAQARCTGPNASSTTTALSNTATVIRTIDTPAAPTYLGPNSFGSNVHIFVNYSGSCPAGTTQANGTFRSRAWTGGQWGPYNFGTEDWWTNTTGSNKNVEYWGRYRCTTTHSTSNYSPESYNVVVITP